MITNYSRRESDDIHIRMDIAIDLPATIASELERLGIYEFEQCTYHEDARRLTASITTTLYGKGA